MQNLPARVLEGSWDGFVTLLRFADLSAAEKWYDSSEYKAVRHLRQQSSTPTALVVDGVAPGHTSADLPRIPCRGRGVRPGSGSAVARPYAHAQLGHPVGDVAETRVRGIQEQQPHHADRPAAHLGDQAKIPAIGPRHRVVGERRVGGHVDSGQSLLPRPVDVEQRGVGA